MLGLLACLSGSDVWAAVRPADEAPLVVDLSDHMVAITTGFAGANVLLFGAVREDGDVVVVVRGPPQTEKLRRKGQVLGVWANRAEATVTGAPAYYGLASSRALDQTAAADVLARYQIGPEQLTFTIERQDSGADDADYRAAWLRLKRRQGLYAVAPSAVSFVGHRLFRAEMAFPANVPTGRYQVDVYLLRDGKLAAIQTTPLTVGKSGLSAEVFDFAHRRSASYGIIAVLLAVLAGWAAALMFRRT